MEGGDETSTFSARLSLPTLGSPCCCSQDRSFPLFSRPEGKRNIQKTMPRVEINLVPIFQSHDKQDCAGV